MILSLVITYQNLMAAFRDQDGVVLLLWLVVDLVMVFLTHFSVSRTIFGILLRKPKLKNRGTNAVILRSLSGKMTVNSVMIGLLAQEHSSISYDCTPRYDFCKSIRDMGVRRPEQMESLGDFCFDFPCGGGNICLILFHYLSHCL